MTQNTIPVPASTLEKLSTAALSDAQRASEKGHTWRAIGILEASAKAKEIAHDVDGGKFVSIKGSDLSTLCSSGYGKAPDASNTAEKFLEQYNVW